MWQEGGGSGEKQREREGERNGERGEGRRRRRGGETQEVQSERYQKTCCCEGEDTAVQEPSERKGKVACEELNEGAVQVEVRIEEAQALMSPSGTNAAKSGRENRQGTH